MSSGKMKFEIVDCLALLGGVVIAVAFFLPWAGDMNGFGYSDYIRSLEGNLYFIFSIALYFVFILGLGIVLEAILSIIGQGQGSYALHVLRLCDHHNGPNGDIGQHDIHGFHVPRHRYNHRIHRMFHGPDVRSDHIPQGLDAHAGEGRRMVRSSGYSEG